MQCKGTYAYTLGLRSLPNHSFLRFFLITNILCALQNKLQGWVFDIVTHQMFEITIMMLIIANMATMMIEYHGMTTDFVMTLDYINYVFVAVFTGEATVKVTKLSLFETIVLYGK